MSVRDTVREDELIALDMRRSRRKWRLLAFVFLALALVVLVARLSWGMQTGVEDQIARVRIDGVIATDASRLAALNRLGEADHVKAVIVAINSPGGTTAGGEELYEALASLRAKKPVVAVIHELGASAAYMTAISSDRIFARRLSIVGSIGVLYQHINAGGLMETIGIDIDKVATGPLKAEPDFNEPLQGAARQSLQTLVDDSFEWFVDVVAERRGMARAVVLELADGRIVTGRMAVANGLIDAIGSETEAIAWLEAERDIAEDLPVRTHFPVAKTELERLLNVVGADLKSAVGFGAGAGMTLDGLISLWQFDVSL